VIFYRPDSPGGETGIQSKPTRSSVRLKKGCIIDFINPASIDMTGVGAYAAYLMGLEFIDEQSPV